MTAQYETGTPGSGGGNGKAKYLRVKVVDHGKEGSPTVNVRMPIGVVKLGMRMAANFSPKMKDTDLDWDAITRMIDEGATGELVHVEDEAEHKVIDVFVE
jgi:hypothetical protein